MDGKPRPAEPSAGTPSLGHAIDREVRRSKHLLRLFLVLAALPILVAVGLLLFGKSDAERVQQDYQTVSNSLVTIQSQAVELKEFAAQVELQSSQMVGQAVSAEVKTMGDKFDFQVDRLSAEVKESRQQHGKLMTEVAGQQRDLQQAVSSFNDLARDFKTLSAGPWQSERSNWVSATEFRELAERLDQQSRRLMQVEKSTADLAPKLKQLDDVTRRAAEMEQLLRRFDGIQNSNEELKLRLQRLERTAVHTR